MKTNLYIECISQTLALGSIKIPTFIWQMLKTAHLLALVLKAARSFFAAIIAENHTSNSPITKVVFYSAPHGDMYSQRVAANVNIIIPQLQLTEQM